MRVYIPFADRYPYDERWERKFTKEKFVSSVLGYFDGVPEISVFAVTRKADGSGWEMTETDCVESECVLVDHALISSDIFHRFYCGIGQEVDVRAILDEMDANDPDSEFFDVKLAKWAMDEGTENEEAYALHSTMVSLIRSRHRWEDADFSFVTKKKTDPYWPFRTISFGHRLYESAKHFLDTINNNPKYYGKWVILDGKNVLHTTPDEEEKSIYVGKAGRPLFSAVAGHCYSLVVSEIEFT